MGRRSGSKDKKVRKRRKDCKHKYVKRNGKFVPYVSKRSKDDPIKIWIWMVFPMRLDSYRHFSVKSRLKIRKTVYKPYMRIDVEPERLSNIQEIKNLFLEVIGHEGDFLLKTFGHAKNSHHCTARAVAKVSITKHSKGLRVHVKPSYKNRGLYRYWFWQERR